MTPRGQVGVVNFILFIMVANVDALSSELSRVEDQIGSIEQEITYLQGEKRKLLERKDVLTAQLESMKDLDTTAAGPAAAMGTGNQRERDGTTDWENGRFPWTNDLYSKLTSQFSLDSFRSLQLSCINATLSNRDVILIMPTGGGKSLCYQLPAVISEGFTLVISPLVSLMQDQLRSVERIGIESCMLNADSSKEHVNEVHSNMTDKKNKSLKLVYVTPEKVAKSKRFMSKLEKAYKDGRLARIVIDEVHCASQWGHDFRPDYKVLGILKRQFPSVPIMGLTATATMKVLEDCKTLLRLESSCLVFKASYNRPNLFYEIRDKAASHKDHINDIASLIQKDFHGQSGILYCFSQKESEEMCRSLNGQGIRSGCYHAGMSSHDRTESHMNWINNKIQVIVATVAFGMGIDKGDVRFVIHHSISKSMENYYQESGRAGRDGLVSVCVLYYRIADMFRQSTMVQAEYTGLQNLYAMINYCINQSKCRRQVIAHHFGEVWNTSDCAKMCDICRLRQGGGSSGADVLVSDVTHIGTGFIEMLEDARMYDQRMTAAKLVDSWKSSDASKENRMVGKKELEYILARCIMEGVLREDYHFTPYNTISYIVPGARAGALKAKRVKVKMETLSQNNGASFVYPMDRIFDKSFGSPPPGPIEEQGGVESTTTPGSCGVGSVSSPSTAASNRKPASLLAKRKADSCSSGFSTIDEDFVVTPKRHQQHRTPSATKLSSCKPLKGTSNKSRKKSSISNKSILLFTSSGSSKSVSVTPEPPPSTSDIIEINSSDSSSD